MTAELYFQFVKDGRVLETGVDGYFVGDWFSDWDDAALTKFPDESVAIEMRKKLNKSYRGPDTDGVGVVIRVLMH